MYNLAEFSLTDMTRCGVALRKCGAGASSLEDVAARAARLLYDSLRDDRGERACALVRCFVSLPFASLPSELQRLATEAAGPEEPLRPDTRCLTLLGTAGANDAWNDRRASRAHQALPLVSAASLERSPMVARLLAQFGVQPGDLLAPGPELMLEAGQHSFNVFHVPTAAGSPHIPAQREFVVPFGIASVLGFGSALPGGALFAIILFSRCAVTRQAAELFKPLALNVKVAFLPHVGSRVFS